MVLFQKTCYSPNQLLAIYNSQTGNTVSKQKFMELCPSLLYQQVSGSCSGLSSTPVTEAIGDAESKFLSRDIGFRVLFNLCCNLIRNADI